MKKILCLILSCLLLLTLLVSCNKTGDQTTTENVQTTADNQTTADDKQVTTEAPAAWNITFVVTDKSGTLNKTVVVNAKENDTAWDLFKTNFTVGYEDSQYGPYIKTIDGVTADYAVTGTYFALYINGDYATTGIDGVTLQDGMTISFREE